MPHRRPVLSAERTTKFLEQVSPVRRRAAVGPDSYQQICLLSLACLWLVLSPCLAAQSSNQLPPARQRSVTVHSKFGGQIFGFDIDANGTEGVLSEAQDIAGGKVLAAVETFDQTTGKILKVVKKTQNKGDLLTLGIVGGGIGLVEQEHVKDIYVSKRTYPVLNPVDANQITGFWTPPLTKSDIITGISRAQDSHTTVFFAFHNGGSDQSFVFSSDVGANTFGPKIKLKDPVFFFSDSPVIALDSKKNRAAVAASYGSPTSVPEIGLVNLSTGKVTEFEGLGLGFVNGIAVDSASGVACTTTEIDFSVEFYDLKTKTGIIERLPDANNQIYSGADVEYDPVNKLFLIAQPVSSTAASGSSIQVYDSKGRFIESINGLNFSNAFNVVPAHIAINPGKRTGFVDGPDQGVTELQSFTY